MIKFVEYRWIQLEKRKCIYVFYQGGNAAAILSVRFLHVYIGITYTECKIIDINYEAVFLL